MEPLPPLPHKWLPFLEKSVQLAEKAASMGEVPVGALVLDPDFNCLAYAYNQKELRQDPCAHAEVMALRIAAHKLQSWRLSHLTLVCSLEPCLMCFSVMQEYRLQQLVYGAENPKSGFQTKICHTNKSPSLLFLSYPPSAHVLQRFFAAQRLLLKHS